MKKIIPLLLVVMLVVCMAVSASAAEVHAVFRFHDEIELTHWTAGIYPLDFYANGEHFSGFSIGDTAGFQSLSFMPASGGFGLPVYDSVNGWIDERYQSVILNGDYPDELIATISYVGTLYYECDGTACPATDVNEDDICDDCGLPFSLRLIGYPELPVVSGKNLHSVVLHREDGFFYMALTSDTPYTIGGTVGDKYLITVADEQEVTYVTYKCTDGENWVQQNSGKAYATTVGDSSSTLLASTFDWYKDGTLFFQVPLWEKLDRVTQGQMMGLTTETVGTMKILALCGVGCLALLVVLKLFGKRSLIYRN